MRYSRAKNLPHLTTHSYFFLDKWCLARTRVSKAALRYDSGAVARRES